MDKEKECNCQKVETYFQHWSGMYKCSKCKLKLRRKHILDINSYYGN